MALGEFRDMAVWALYSRHKLVGQEYIENRRLLYLLDFAAVKKILPVQRIVKRSRLGLAQASKNVHKLQKIGIGKGMSSK